MNLQFSTKVEFPDGRAEDLDFLAEFTSYSESWEHFGNRGTKHEVELDEITCFSKLNKKEKKYIDKKIEDSYFDTVAWEKYNNQ